VGAIAAAVDNKDFGAVDIVLEMMKNLVHRGDDAFGIGTPDEVRFSNRIEDLNTHGLRSSFAIGYSLMKLFPRDIRQPLKVGRKIVAFDGTICPVRAKPYLNALMKSALQKKNSEAIADFVRTRRGAYVIASLQGEKMILARDPVGQKPLYLGENERLVAAASERKALWRVGLDRVESFPPGYVMSLTRKRRRLQHSRTIRQPEVAGVDLESAAKHLRRLLVKTVIELTKDIERVAIAFSGGIDSGLIASIAKSTGLEVELFTVSLPDQPELAHAIEVGSELRLPHQVKQLTIADVEEAVKTVLWHIEEANPMKLAVAIPLYFAAAMARREGFRVMLAGQGCDEIFGGYRRFLAILDRGGADALQKAIRESSREAYRVNYQRDEQVSVPHHIDLRLPFADLNVVEYALSLPTELKIASPKDDLRKIVLRRLAQIVNLPKSVVERPKKAIQYATGIERALRHIAKKRNMTLEEYVVKSFDEVFKNRQNALGLLLPRFDAEKR
jgi:asparagine synthase (glutamine-hydrolysing)